MKKLVIYALLTVLIVSCKHADKPTTAPENLSVKEKIARANGFENWDQVEEIQFTFNVDRDTTHFERAWIWHPKTNDVTLRTEKDTIAYNRSAVDSTSMDADKAFINDKFWMLAPFQLMWDTSATVSDAEKVSAPISNTLLNKITLTYPDEGGYTPGDAYDFFFDDDYIIKEWNYRKGNAATPTLSTTWQDYKKFNGINIATMHTRPDSNFKLYFTNIEVKN